MRQGFSYLERIADKACPVLDTGCVRLSTKDARQNNNLEPLSDSKGTRNALAKAILLFLFSFTPAFGAATPHLLTPNDAKSGTLMLETQIEGQYIEAPALMTDVMMTISGPLARVKVTQRFENTSAAWVEGVYVFPLPEKSAVDTLRMQIGDRFIEGRIEEKQKAKAIYEAAKEAGHKASLLEQNRPNLFTNHAANIGPGETLIVQIEYQEIVKLDAGQFSLRFPMVAAPRYTPAPLFMTASLDGESGWGSDNRDLISPPILHPDMGEVNPVQITVDLHAGFALGEINSAYHPMAVDHQTPEKATLTLKDGPTPANRDFVLHWKPKASEAPSLALFKEEVEGVPYYLLMLSPPAGAEPPSRAREVTFVIDTSGSMAGASIRQAQKSLSMAIQRLNPDDHFNLIEFNSRTHALFQTPLPATPSRTSAAISWVERLNADGGTEMLPALHKAFKGSGSPSHLRQVIFLTDGAIGNEEALFNAIHLHREDARVFTVGIGAAPNSYFMVRAAEIGQGSFTHIGDIHEVSDRMEDLFRKLENPLVTDLKLTWPEGVNVEAWPNPLPDIYDGEPLVVAARADDAAGEVQVTGISSLQPWQVALPLAQASTRSGISKHWARQKMASLELARHRMPQDTLVFEKNILQTALTHGLVSRLTSLVAVDITPSRPQDMSLESQILPLNLPEGWDFDKVFGEDISSAPLSPLNTDILKEASTIAVGTDRDLSQTERGLILPQTATLFEIKALLALLLMIFSSLSLWRLSKSHCSRSI